MNDAGKNQGIESHSKKLFDDSVERLDAATLSRLNQGRHQAIAELQQSQGSAVFRRWAPLTGVAAAALVAVMLVRGPAAVDMGEEAVTASDFEMLLQEDGIEMFEDLEFYSLLDAVDPESGDDVG
jgi:hypothetical protein